MISVVARPCAGKGEIMHLVGLFIARFNGYDSNISDGVMNCLNSIEYPLGSVTKKDL